jgi:hypothetical protein
MHKQEEERANLEPFIARHKGHGFAHHGRGERRNDHHDHHPQRCSTEEEKNMRIMKINQ